MRKKHEHKNRVTKLQNTRWAIVSDHDYVDLSFGGELLTFAGRRLIGIPKKNVSNFTVSLQQKAKLE